MQVYHFIFISGLIFYISLLGILLNRKSLIHILVCLELLLLSVNINFIGFSKLFSDLKGQIFSLFSLTVAAAEVAIGLAIILVYFRNKGNISIQDPSEVEANLSKEHKEVK